MAEPECEREGRDANKLLATIVSPPTAGDQKTLIHSGRGLRTPTVHCLRRLGGHTPVGGCRPVALRPRLSAGLPLSERPIQLL